MSDSCSDCSESSGDLCHKHNIEEIERVIQSLENTPVPPINIFETDESMETQDEHNSDDDIEVVRADIYKYHGGDNVENLDQQIEEGILKFEYRDEDPMDDDILEIEIVNNRSDRRKKTETVTIDEESESEEDDQDDQDDKDEETDLNRTLTCEDCGCFVKSRDLLDHREEKHPRQDRRIKQFKNGNFFMLAD